jgi:hypothetical protein
MTTKPLRIILLLTAAACGEGAAEASRTVVRDSAGIQIVENSGAAWEEGEGWRLSEQPVLQIGELDGPEEYQLYRVSGAIRLPDGRIVVANGGHELRFYEANGSHVRSAGRKGGGPGEFEALGSLRAVGPDSLMAVDWQLQRVSFFDTRGAFLGSFPIPAVEGTGRPRLIGRFGDGTLMVAGGRSFGADARGGLHVDSSLYVRVTPDGEPLDTMGSLPAGESFVIREGQGMTVTSRAFGRSPQHDLRGQRFYFGNGESYTVDVYSSQGTLEHRIRRVHDNLAVTEEDVRRFKEERLENATDPDWRPRTERSLAEMPYPATMPAYSRIILDSEGNLWVAPYRRPGDEQPRWDVFDPDGQWLGTVETPPDFRVTEIGADYVLGVYRDELDVEQVQLYTLRK